MIHNSIMHDLPYFTVFLQENVELNKRIFMESNEDITLRPFSELTMKDVTPYLRELIQEEMSNCLVNKKLPPAFSGIKDSTIEHFLTNPELYTIGLKGLADLLHCSIKSAYNYKRSGKYDPAIHKIGKRFVINKEIALEIATGKYRGCSEV